jgi:glycosyltransferase involved in cell wall biosynthesis
MARNFGLSFIKGDWFAFWDADDLPNLQNVFSAIAQGTGYEILIGQFEVVSRDGVATKFEITKDLAGHLVKNPGLWRMIFNMDLQKKIQFPPIRMAEDQIALSSLQIFDLRVQLYEYVFYTYFQSFPGQLTSNKRALDDLITAVELSANNLRYSSKCNLRLDYGLHIKQILTGVKKGSFITKVTIIKNEAYFFIKGEGLSRIEWIKAVFWNLKIWWKSV